MYMGLIHLWSLLDEPQTLFLVFNLLYTVVQSLSWIFKQWSEHLTLVSLRFKLAIPLCVNTFNTTVHVLLSTCIQCSSYKWRAAYKYYALSLASTWHGVIMGLEIFFRYSSFTVLSVYSQTEHDNLLGFHRPSQAQF